MKQDTNTKNFQRREFLRLSGGALAIAGLGTLTACGGGGGGDTEEQPLTDGQEGLVGADALLFDSAETLPPVNLAAVVLADGTTLAELAGRTAQPPSVRKDSRKTTRVVGRAETAAKTPEQYKRDFIKGMTEKGNFLIDRSNHKFLKDDIGQKQNGLAYVWGGRDITKRAKATENAGCCTEMLYGLDCSGLIYVCANHAGVPLPSKVQAKTLVIPETWNKILPPEWNLRMVILEDSDRYQNGDIIGTTGHVGFFAFDNPSMISIIQSNGNTGCDNNGKVIETECEKMYGTGRGPRRIKFSEIKSYFLTDVRNTKRLRLVPKVTFLVELRWGAQPDMDLHVIEPNGTQVFYDNLKGTSGELDFDATEPGGTEHYRPKTGLADGIYKIGVNYFEGIGPETAKIVITAGAETKSFSKTFQEARGKDYNLKPEIVATVEVATNKITGEAKIAIKPA